jgi:hypothetical protein
LPAAFGPYQLNVMRSFALPRGAFFARVIPTASFFPIAFRRLAGPLIAIFTLPSLALQV